MTPVHLLPKLLVTNGTFVRASSFILRRLVEPNGVLILFLVGHRLGVTKGEGVQGLSSTFAVKASTADCKFSIFDCIDWTASGRAEYLVSTLFIISRKTVFAKSSEHASHIQKTFFAFRANCSWRGPSTFTHTAWKVAPQKPWQSTLSFLDIFFWQCSQAMVNFVSVADAWNAFK